MASGTPTLYSSLESGNSYKVRLLADLIKQPLDIVPINLGLGQQHSPEYTKINPRGEVPCLVDGDHVLSDSAAILVYLAGKHPESKYWSDEVHEQAQIVDWLAFAASWVQYGVFTARAILSYGGPFNGLGSSNNFSDEDRNRQLKESNIRGHKSLQILNAHLGKNKWLVLERPTIADCAVFPYVALAPMGDIELDAYPHVRRWINDIKKLPGFQSMPGLDDPMIHRRG